jgi:Glyoxalase-like domain
MQMHLDFTVSSLDELQRQRQRAESLGAQLLLDRTDDSNEPLYVLADPQAIRSASSSPDLVNPRLPSSLICRDAGTVESRIGAVCWRELRDPSSARSSLPGESSWVVGRQLVRI